MRYLLLFTAGFAAVCGIGCYFPQIPPYILPGVSLLPMLISVFQRRKLLRKAAMVIALGALLAGLWVWCYGSYVWESPRQLDGVTRQVEMTADDYSEATQYGASVTARLNLDQDSYRVKVYLNTDTPVVPGTVLSGTFRFRCTLGGLEPATFHKGQGIYLLAYPEGRTEIAPTDGSSFYYFPVVLRHRILEIIDRAFPEDAVAFAKALLLGDDSGLDYAVNTAFTVTGIRHIVAVSGLHVSIFLALICLFTGKRPVLTAVIGFPVLLLFAAAVGFTPSITRACVMQALLWLSLCVGKEYDPPTALAAAALVVLVQNPMAVTSVSFQLSFGSIGGIFLFGSRLQRYFLRVLGGGKGNSMRSRAARFFAASLAISLSANSLIQPLVAYYFGTVSLVGVLANLLILWSIPIAFGGILCIALVGAVWPGGAWLLGKVAALPIRYILTISETLAELPFAAVYTSHWPIALWLAVCYVLLLVFLLGKRKQPLLCGLLCVLTLCITLTVSYLQPLWEPFRLTVLDVGQGQCILLQSDGKTYMVDCGGDSEEAVADLAAQTLLLQGITRLDGMILTHYDTDHAGAAQNLLQRIPADTLYLPAAEDSSGILEGIQEKMNTVVVDRDLLLTFGGTQITVFSSQNLRSSNESSLCILFQKENCDILITGDRSTAGEFELLQTGRIPDLEILIAGHHGAENSTGAFLLEKTRPETVIVSAGADNPYGHPSEALLERLRFYGCAVRRTDLEGTIMIVG